MRAALRLVGRGHGSIRATHRKTLEFAREPDLTERGTCIVAVGTEDRHSTGTLPLAGPVRITIAAGSESFAFDADANSGWDPAGPMVVRRGPLRLPGTFAINATAAADDLPAPLVAALRDPAAVVDVVAEPRPGAPTVVLIVADPGAPPTLQLIAELIAADAVNAEDDGARRLVSAAARVTGDIRPAGGTPDGRVVAVATAELPGRTVELDGRRVETVGMPAPLAAAAALPWAAPITFHPTPDDAALRRVPAAHRLVVGVEPRRLAGLLADAREVRGARLAVVRQAFADPVVVDTAGAAPEFAGAGRLWCAFGPATDGELDPAVRAAIAGLLADGTPSKPAARALAALTGWPQRRAYDAVLSLTRG